MDTLGKSGVTFSTPDKHPFRAALKEAGFYSDWQKKFGDEPWALLTKYTGAL